jgi:hypothetical protein
LQLITASHPSRKICIAAEPTSPASNPGLNAPKIGI